MPKALVVGGTTAKRPPTATNLRRSLDSGFIAHGHQLRALEAKGLKRCPAEFTGQAAARRATTGRAPAPAITVFISPTRTDRRPRAKVQVRIAGLQQAASRAAYLFDAPANPLAKR